MYSISTTPNIDDTVNVAWNSYEVIDTDLDNCLIVHIRRTDNKWARPKRVHVSNIAKNDNGFYLK